MKRYDCVIGVALLLGIGGCGDSPTEPSKDESRVVFTAQLAASNEVPPITNAEKDARGDVRITMVPVRDASGTITGGTLSVVLNLSNFPSPSMAVAAHIHAGGPGETGKAVIGVPPAMLSAIVPLSMANGTAANVRYNSIPLDNADKVSVANQMVANPNGFYFNVHSGENPTGAVRGQLVKQ